MTVWVVMWDEEIKDICTSKKNAISAAKNFLTAELQDEYIRFEEAPTSTRIKGYKHEIIIYNQETDLWV